MYALEGHSSDVRGGTYEYNDQVDPVNEAGCFYLNSKKYGASYSAKFKELHEGWGLGEGPIKKIEKEN